jgi:hypothetical protein
MEEGRKEGGGIGVCFVHMCAVRILVVLSLLKWKL